MRAAARWLPALAVALGAAVATAHGVFEVASAARVPAAIAWLYPVITDGLALVAYAATARLRGRAARYAWTVVVVAAGLSGLAQAVYLASEGLTASTAVRFGVGAWPAVACALVAHLLHLVATAEPRSATTGQRLMDAEQAAPSADPVQAEQLSTPEPDADIDHRVVALARRLARGEDLNGPAVATELGLSERTGRRLLGDARAHLEQQQPLHLVTSQEPPA